MVGASRPVGGGPGSRRSPEPLKRRLSPLIPMGRVTILRARASCRRRRGVAGAEGLRPFSPPNRLPPSFLRLRQVAPAPCSRVPAKPVFPLQPHRSRGPGKQQALLRRATERKGTMSEFRDVYSRITNKIIADLEQGVRPWMRPWSAEHAAGRITRPLRHNGVPYTRSAPWITCTACNQAQRRLARMPVPKRLRLDRRAVVQLCTAARSSLKSQEKSHVPQSLSVPALRSRMVG